jgi:hypothetical protein
MAAPIETIRGQTEGQMILALVKMARAHPEKSEAEIAELWRAHAAECAEEENIKQAVNSHQLGAFEALLDWQAVRGGGVALCDCLRADCPDMAKVYRESEGFRDPSRMADAVPEGVAGEGDPCEWCGKTSTGCHCDEEICRDCDFPEDDCHCHLIDRCCPECGSDGRCYCAEDTGPSRRAHYCGDEDCNGDCGALSCGCWDTCRGYCRRQRGGF